MSKHRRYFFRRCDSYNLNLSPLCKIDLEDGLKPAPWAHAAKYSFQNDDNNNTVMPFTNSNSVVSRRPLTQPLLPYDIKIENKEGSLFSYNPT